jgi:hypothetical protein
MRTEAKDILARVTEQMIAAIDCSREAKSLIFGRRVAVNRVVAL